MRGRSGLVLAALLLSACAGADLGQRELEPPLVTLADIQLHGAGLLEQRLGLVLRIRNPNPVDLPLDGLTVRLDIDGEPFATGISNEDVTVGALAEEMVTVEAVSATTVLLDQLRRVTGLEEFDYRLSGTLFLRGEDRRSLPFEGDATVRLGAPVTRSFTCCGRAAPA